MVKYRIAEETPIRFSCVCSRLTPIAGRSTSANGRTVNKTSTSNLQQLLFDLAEWIGLDVYNWLTQCREQPAMGTAAPAGSLLGERFFADLVVPGNIPRA